MIGRPTNSGALGGNFGKAPPQNNKMLSLAALVIDEDDFEQSFTETKNEEKMQPKARRATKKENQNVDQLLQQGKYIFVKGKQHEYKEEDPIFFMREPNHQRIKQAQCLSSDLEF